VNALPPFQTLFDEHHRPVLAFLRGMVGPDAAEDCLQETFLAALHAYPRADGRSLKSWLFTIARNKAVDHHRKRVNAPKPTGDVEVLDGAAPESAPGWLAGANAATNERDAEIWGAVAALPEGQRAAVLLRFAVDLRYGEIGRSLGCSEDAARRRVADGLKTLRAAQLVKEVA
jgi:RNA polymerase sigma factor (sigma-70 family)